MMNSTGKARSIFTDLDRIRAHYTRRMIAILVVGAVLAVAIVAAWALGVTVAEMAEVVVAAWQWVADTMRALWNAVSGYFAGEYR